MTYRLSEHSTLNPEAPIFQPPSNGASCHPTIPVARESPDPSQHAIDPTTQNTTATNDSPSGRIKRRNPQFPRNGPTRNIRAAPSAGQRTTPPSTPQKHNTLHPSKTSDLIWKQELAFLNKPNKQWLKARNPFIADTFAASRTPVRTSQTPSLLTHQTLQSALPDSSTFLFSFQWWSHWLIAFAHMCTDMEGGEICDVYKVCYEGFDSRSGEDGCGG